MTRSTRRAPRWIRVCFAAGLLVAIVALDLRFNLARTLFVGPAESQAASEEPLQVQGLPILRPGTLTLGEGNPTVAVAASIDAELSDPAPIDQDLSYAQVDAIVRRALDLDRSGASIRDVIGPGDEVLIKVNSVTNRGRLDQKQSGTGYYHGGFEHPGQITDLRVVKSLIAYLIEHVGPRRILIAEGGAESPRRGEPGFPSGLEDDSWSVTYPEFDGLSYVGIAEEFRALGVETVVDTSDLNYAPYRREPVPGGALQRLGVTRLRYPGAQFGFHVEGTGSFRAEGYYMPEPVLDADKVISVPAMKTTIYGTTLALKNYVGVLASAAYGDGTSKREHYQNNPEHGYVDLFAYNPPVYSVIEGFWGTEGHGPQWGHNVQHNVVVAGSDPLAAEAIANVTMGFDALDLEALYLAAAKGFGTIDRRRIRVVGREPESVQRHFAKSGGGSGQGFFYGRGIRRWLVAGPFEGRDVDEAHLPGEADLRPLEGETAGAGSWVRAEHLGYSAEILDLGEIAGGEGNSTSYAFALVHSPGDQEGFLWLGFQEHLRVWLNGEEVFSRTSPASFALAAEKVPVRLQAGENRLLFKAASYSGETMLAAHVVDEDGDRLPGIRFALPGEMLTAVAATEAGAVPASHALLGNYPNPFNASTHLRFALSVEADVGIAVYNVAGQRVRQLVEGPAPAGVHEVVWDGRGDGGASAASGVYVAVMEARGGRGSAFRQSRSMALLR